jgi:hypothetical protein
VVTVNDLLQPELYCPRLTAMLPLTFLTGFTTGMLITTLVQTDDVVASRSFASAGLDAPRNLKVHSSKQRAKPPAQRDVGHFACVFEYAKVKLRVAVAF